jgi:hypothetical protein
MDERGMKLQLTTPLLLVLSLYYGLNGRRLLVLSPVACGERERWPRKDGPGLLSWVSWVQTDTM